MGSYWGEWALDPSVPMRRGEDTDPQRGHRMKMGETPRRDLRLPPTREGRFHPPLPPLPGPSLVTAALGSSLTWWAVDGGWGLGAGGCRFSKPPEDRAERTPAGENPQQRPRAPTPGSSPVGVQLGSPPVLQDQVPLSTHRLCSGPYWLHLSPLSRIPDWSDEVVLLPKTFDSSLHTPSAPNLPLLYTGRLRTPTMSQRFAQAQPGRENKGPRDNPRPCCPHPLQPPRGCTASIPTEVCL